MQRMEGMDDDDDDLNLKLEGIYNNDLNLKQEGLQVEDELPLNGDAVSGVEPESMRTSTCSYFIQVVFTVKAQQVVHNIVFSINVP